MTMPGFPGSATATAAGSLSFSDPTGAIRQYAQQNLINAADPMVASAIASVQHAAAAEGLPVNSQEVLARVNTLFTSYQQIYNNPSAGSIANASQVALGAARQFVKQNHEVDGALGTVQGLVTAFQQTTSGHSTPQEVAAGFAGPVMAAAAAAGAVTAGVGAAVVVGLSIASQLLDAAGFMSAKPGIQICPAFKYTGGGTPSYAIECMAVFDTGGEISPGSVNWRGFPNLHNPADAWWFAPMGGQGAFTDWHKARWISRPNAGGVPIMEAFPWYNAVAGNADDVNFARALKSPRQITATLQRMGAKGLLPRNLSREQSTALISFDGVFVKAWESNKEYWLNGHKGAADEDVFVHAVEVWNRAHERGQGVAVLPSPLSDSTLYWATAPAQHAVNLGNKDLLTADMTAVLLHTGPRKVLKKVPVTPASAAFPHNFIHISPVVMAFPPKPPVPAWRVPHVSKLGLLLGVGGLIAGSFTGTLGAVVSAGIGYVLGVEVKRFTK